ncbi:hypothetical protein C8P68_101437 [Mucilaginibacter yixingensis]|uniref:Uncharacterized protein n=1 Tax=Mucilaginibacter yixingensis TaxID=1295612 RepID=A0A2T5JFJ1_9SPHI|nr:hypothetical protein [Mucilaginibacter yixingensis]PTR01203.1 hypothetical protein C8P68_101437 [Mucilaginibacter yixingensis]
MATLSTRQKLISYLADADESKVEALYILLEKDIAEEQSLILTEEQVQLLAEERQSHISGQSKSYTRQEAREIIKGHRNF